MVHVGFDVIINFLFVANIAERQQIDIRNGGYKNVKAEMLSQM